MNEKFGERQFIFYRIEQPIKIQISKQYTGHPSYLNFGPKYLYLVNLPYVVDVL